MPRAAPHGQTPKRIYTLAALRQRPGQSYNTGLTLRAGTAGYPARVASGNEAFRGTLHASASFRTQTRSLHVPSSIPALTHPSAPPPTWRIALHLLDQNPHQPQSQMDKSALANMIDSI